MQVITDRSIVSASEAEQPQRVQQELCLQVSAAVKKVERREVIEADRMWRSLQCRAFRGAVRVEESGARALDDGADAACERRLLAEAVHWVNVTAALEVREYEAAERGGMRTDFEGARKAQLGTEARRSFGAGLELGSG